MPKNKNLPVLGWKKKKHFTLLLKNSKQVFTESLFTMIVNTFVLEHLAAIVLSPESLCKRTASEGLCFFCVFVCRWWWWWW